MNKSVSVTIESIDIEGKGVAHIDGKAVFISGVLPGEIAEIEIYKQKPSYDLGRLTKLITQSDNRVEPQCVNFGVCGGCSLQHIDYKAQVEYKQQALIDNLKHIGKVTPNSILPPLYGNPWNYRHRARLSSRYVIKKESALVGFREKASSYVANMNECLILPKFISELIPGLRNLLASLSIRDKIPQIEVAIGSKLNVLVFRIMHPLTLSDEEKIKNFVDINSTLADPLQIWLQPNGPDSCYPLYPATLLPLSYDIKAFNIEMPYYPTEFTQINPEINEQMINLALKLLDPKSDEIIFDFFCGIGNFTLPIATRVSQVIGIEGSHQLVNRALANAKHNKLEHKVKYQVANLFKIDENWLKSLGKANKWLIDPPRDGAIELIQSISLDTAPDRIIYISCNPATLSRDAATLVNTHGYTLKDAGVINMFPHTSHVESIAVFEK